MSLSIGIESDIDRTLLGWTLFVCIFTGAEAEIFSSVVVVVDVVEDASVGAAVDAVGSSSDGTECIGADISVNRENIFVEDTKRLKILGNVDSYTYQCCRHRNRKMIQSMPWPNAFEQTMVLVIFSLVHQMWDMGLASHKDETYVRCHHFAMA